MRQRSGKSDRALPYLKKWNSIYLKAAQARFRQQLKGYDLSIEDVDVFQQPCTYEASARTPPCFCCVQTSYVGSNTAALCYSL
jgi:hypothetical protein